MTIGTSPQRWEAVGKLTGKTKYTADVLLPGLLHAKLLRSPYPHARIVSIDTSQAAALPGVHAIITAADLPSKTTGQKRKDIPVLASDRVRFAGERVAAVAAENLEIAEQAVELIQVTYEPLPVMTEPWQALADDAIALHEDLPEKNVFAREYLGKGNIEEGFAEADVIFEHEYTTQIVHQAYMEPRVSQVVVDKDGKVTIWTSNKAPFGLRKLFAEYVGLDEESVRVIATSIGGDFGGKSMLLNEPICYYLSLATGRPVRLALTRAEEFQSGNPRHASVIRVKSGVDKQGKLTARRVSVLFNGGAYAGFNANVYPKGGTRAAGAYDIPNTQIEVCSVATNLMHCGHMRSPGNPQVYFAVESHMDEIARELGYDPLEFRMLNAVQGDAVSPTGKVWQDTQLHAVLAALQEKIRQEPMQQPRGPWRYGWGVACAERNIGVGRSQAKIHLLADGTFEIITGAVDVGTGLPTLLRQIAAEELKIPTDNITVTLADTEQNLYDQGAGSSRHTHTAGRALMLAIEDLKQAASSIAEEYFECPPELVEYVQGAWQLLNRPERSISWSDVARLAEEQERSVSGFGAYESKAPGQTCFAAHAAHVAVDVETGQLRVLKVIAVHDIGKALFPQALLGQVEGSVLQGVGFAVYEQISIQDGQPLTTLFSDYGFPSTCEVPEVEAIFIEGGASPGPYNAKSIGEIGTDPVAAAIANAVEHACGIRIRDLPITAERILNKLKEQRRQDQNAAS